MLIRKKNIQIYISAFLTGVCNKSQSISLKGQLISKADSNHLNQKPTKMFLYFCPNL